MKVFVVCAFALFSTLQFQAQNTVPAPDKPGSQALKQAKATTTIDADEMSDLVVLETTIASNGTSSPNSNPIYRSGNSAAITVVRPPLRADPGGGPGPPAQPATTGTYIPGGAVGTYNASPIYKVTFNVKLQNQGDKAIKSLKFYCVVGAIKDHKELKRFKFKKKRAIATGETIELLVTGEMSNPLYLPPSYYVQTVITEVTYGKDAPSRPSEGKKP